MLLYIWFMCYIQPCSLAMNVLIVCAYMCASGVVVPTEVGIL